MTDGRLVLTELAGEVQEGDFLPAVAEAVLQLPMESDVQGVIGTGRYERSGERPVRLPQQWPLLRKLPMADHFLTGPRVAIAWAQSSAWAL